MKFVEMAKSVTGPHGELDGIFYVIEEKTDDGYVPHLTFSVRDSEVREFLEEAFAFPMVKHGFGRVRRYEKQPHGTILSSFAELKQLCQHFRDQLAQERVSEILRSAGL